MTGKSSFSALRAKLLARGASERTATRKAKFLASAPHSEFVRLTPEQNVKAGFSPKARRYAVKGVRITKSTPTISARQHETKRAAELFGLSPEQATEARRQGAIDYSSAAQRERVAKAKRTRDENAFVKRVEAAERAGERVANHSPDPLRHGRSWRTRRGSAERIRELRRRKLAGEFIPDGEWQELIDYADRFEDPEAAKLRGSPGAYSFGF